MKTYLKKYNRTHIYTLVIIMMLFLSGISVTSSYAETEYGYQGLTGTVETTQGIKEYNNIKLVYPSEITVLHTASKPGGYFLNKINTPVDGTAGRIEFAISMTAGMNNIGNAEDGWNFYKYNLNPDPKYDERLEGRKTQVNIYALKSGDQYTGEKWSENRTPIVSNDLGNLHIDDNKTYPNITNGDGSGRVTMYTEKELESGEYILEFGALTCGNNVQKVLGVPVAFQFTVEGKMTFDEALTEAKRIRQEVESNTGSKVGQYRDDGSRLDKLKTAIASAEQLDDQSTVEERDAAAGKLNEAIEALNKVRIVDISFDDISGVGSSISVGASGTAGTKATTEPAMTGSVKKYSFEASDNIQIDARTGEWTALWEGDGWIKVTSVWHRDNKASIPDGKTPASKTVKVNVKSEKGTLALGVPKSSSGSDVSMLQYVAEKAAASGVSLDTDSLRIYTARGAELNEADFAYIRTNLSKLVSVDISKADVSEIPSGAFQGMSSLKTVKLPDGLGRISTRAFKGCSVLKNICISSGVTSIGAEAFSGCKALNGGIITVKAVTPPDVTVYPDDAFAGIKPAEIKVPYGCGNDYKKDAYWKKFNIAADQTEEKLNVEVSHTGGLQEAAEAAIASGTGGSEADVDTLVIKTADGAVLNYAQDIPYLQKNFMNATTVDLSDAVIEDNKFKSNVFKNRKNLKKMRLHEDIINVAGNSFAGCSNLSDIILPAGLQKLGGSAFSGCRKLKFVILDAEQPPMFDGSVFEDTVRKIAVPASSVEKYRDNEAWHQYDIISQIQISLDKAEASVEISKTVDINADVLVYGNCSETVMWESSDPAVAKVSRSIGKSITVTGVKAGTAVITASDVSCSIQASCKVTVKKMDAPGSFKAASAAYNQIKVSWSGVSGAAGYEVFYSTSKDGSYKKKATLKSSARSYTFTGLTTGKTYYFKVRGYKVESDSTRYAGEYTAVKSAKPALSKQSGFKVKAGKRSFTASWKKVSGASGYTVYYSTKKTSGFKSKTVKGNSKVKYTVKSLKKGRTYYVKSRAYRTVSGKKVYGPYTSLVRVKAK